MICLGLTVEMQNIYVSIDTGCTPLNNGLPNLDSSGANYTQNYNESIFTTERQKRTWEAFIAIIFNQATADISELIRSLGADVLTARDSLNAGL